QQISSKDQQIEKLTNLLDQQQRLALQDKKLLEEYKEEIKELKSLMVPVRKDDKYPMVQKSKDIDNTKEELHTKNKKWWHFGRNVK
ncbi:RepB-like protein, partial [Lactococcus cremoris]